MTKRMKQGGDGADRGRPLRPPTDDEKAAIARADARMKGCGETVSVRVSHEGSVSKVGPPHSDQSGWAAMLVAASGSGSGHFAEMVLHQLLRQSRPHGSRLVDQDRVNGFLGLLDGMAPASEVEALLIVQMAAAHDLAMEMAWRAKQADTLPAMNDVANLTVKLMRTYALQAEALAKLRRGGEQRVKVEHVHVHAGGQAIVGTVQTGGGVPPQIEDQPHAFIDPGPDAVRRQDPAGPAMPVAADGKRPL